MRRVLLMLLLVMASNSHAQTATPETSWQSLPSLPPGAKLHVTMDHTGGHTCSFQRVDDARLFCVAGFSGGEQLALPRAGISHVKLANRGRSAWAGAGLGFLTGVVLAVVVSSTHDNAFLGPAILGGGIVFGVVGAATGAVTDFTRGPRVYSRP